MRAGPVHEVDALEKEVHELLSEAAKLTAGEEDVKQQVGQIRANCMTASQSVTAAKRAGAEILVAKEIGQKSLLREAAYAAQLQALEATIKASTA